MKILAIDTATEACSAALYIDGELSSQYQLAPREHSRLILQMIEELLVKAALPVNSLDAIAFGRGPGSFMGLRIAAGVVQGIAFAHEIPVIPVSTLKAIARRASEQSGYNNILTAIDARMDEVYWAAYSKHGESWQLDGEEQVISPDKIQLPAMLAEPGKDWAGAGSGWENYKDRLLKGSNFTMKAMLGDCFPRAEDIAKLAIEDFNTGKTVPAAEAIPVYLRNDVAKKPKPVVL